MIRSRLVNTLNSETHPQAISAYITYLLSSSQRAELPVLAMVCVRADNAFISSFNNPVVKKEIALMIKSRPFVVGGLLQSAHIYSLFLIILIAALKTGPIGDQVRPLFNTVFLPSPSQKNLLTLHPKRAEMVLIRTQSQEQSVAVPLEMLTACLSVLGVPPPAQGGDPAVTERAAGLHSQLVDILFPRSLSDDSSTDTTFLLASSLQRLPLVSEARALSFLATSHPRLVSIGTLSLPLPSFPLRQH